MLPLDEEEERRLFYLINRYGVDAGCKLFYYKHDKKIPLVVLQVYLNKLKRYAKMVKTRQRRPSKAAEVDDEEAAEECQAAEQKLKELDDRLLKVKIRPHGHYGEVIRRKHLVVWAQSFQNNDDVQCMNRAMNLLNDLMVDWVKDIVPVIKMVAKESRRDRSNDGRLPRVTFDLVYKALKMNGNPMSVSAEAAAACEHVPFPN